MRTVIHHATVVVVDQDKVAVGGVGDLGPRFEADALGKVWTAGVNRSFCHESVSEVTGLVVTPF